ncbi:MAG TPA: GGDEF domain-containing protein [Solirubrobacteraceae bacterium]|jgi:diguanylate cyclase (GGDEF)-like protein|nr:GGDEF domain-containing protein [Solirubrobacteraceae bacterium]
MSRSHSLYEGGAFDRREGEAPRVPLAVRLRAAARGAVPARPAIAWSLALLFAFKAAICAVVVISPISPHEPTRLLSAIGVGAILASGCVWLFGGRIPLWGYELLAALGALTASALVARSATHGGVMITALSYPWIAIYSAHFFPRRVVIALGTLVSVGFGAGLLIGGLPNAGVYWVTVTATTWSICIVLGKLSESLRRQADTDPLTGLLNRAGFRTAAEREHAIAQRTGAPLTVAVLDLDGFKQVNDAHGHGVGDRLLVELARSWKQRLRAGDILARHGGDEFVLLLPSTTVESAGAVLERLRDEKLSVRWSIGVAPWLTHESFGECLAQADAHLYSVKNSPRRAAARLAFAGSGNTD